MAGDTVLIENLQQQLDRLMHQLQDLEEERLQGSIDVEEYTEMKQETMDQLKDLSRNLEKMEGGNITLIDTLTATRMAVRAAVSEAFRTPEIVALFARKQPAQLRQKLLLMENELKMHKLTEETHRQRKREGLLALEKLREPLSLDERAFLRSFEDELEFDLQPTSGKTVCDESIVKSARI